MKHWGTFTIAVALLMAAYTGGIAMAEETPEMDTQNASSMAMPMQLPDDGDKLAGVQRSMPHQPVMNAVEEEKAKLSVDMDQTSERLESKIYELKTDTLTTKGAKKRFLLHQKIQKLEGQKAAVNKMHHKVSKNTNGKLSTVKKDWDKLKSHVDKQLGVTATAASASE
jgi:hypothetical protein